MQSSIIDNPLYLRFSEGTFEPEELAMNSTFVYGVFTNATDFSKALSALRIEGLEDVVFLKNTSDPTYTSAVVQNNLKGQFVRFGAAGAIIGGIAGAVASPTVPFTSNFQLITPMMAMVSGAVLCAYFAVWVCGFLNWVDRPILEHEVFEGIISNGAMLLGVTTDAVEQKQAAMRCLDQNGAVELIVRSTRLENVEQLPDPTEVHSNVADNAPRLVA